MLTRLATFAGFAMVLLAILPGVITLGPWIEKEVAPVVTLKATNMYVIPPDDVVTDRRLVMYIEGEKLRPCRFITSTASWWVGNVLVLNTIIVNSEGKTFRAVLQEGDVFEAGPYFVTIPAAVSASSVDVSLHIVYYHDCHIGWPSETLVTIPVRVLNSEGTLLMDKFNPVALANEVKVYRRFMRRD